jgi:two-component system response regulator RegX3
MPPTTTSERVLVVDGDENARRHLRDLLAADGYEVLEAPDGAEALELFAGPGVDLVLLELALAGMSGFNLCRTLRERSDVAIVVVTSLREEVDKVLALEIGADDYITKPFLDRELALRLRAVLRRARYHNGLADRPASPEPSVQLDLDVQLQCVTIDGRQVALSPREFRLLELLLRSGGRLVSRTHILTALWGEEGNHDGKTLDAQVRRLRAKIETDPHRPTLLVTVRGRGYRLAL